MKKIFLVFFILILTSLSAFAEYKPIPENLSIQKKNKMKHIIDVNIDKIDFEITTKMRNFDSYEPVPKTLQDKYIKKIPQNIINNYQMDMDNALKHILYDKITYNHKTLEQMLLDFDQKADSIYQKYLENPNKEQNRIFIEQLKEMNGTISLYPDTIIEQIQPYIEKYKLGLEPGAESDIFLYKYYIEKYHLRYSKDFKKLLNLKEYVYTKIDMYISLVSNKT